jgi:hypothetical protein
MSENEHLNQNESIDHHAHLLDEVSLLPPDFLEDFDFQVLDFPDTLVDGSIPNTTMHLLEESHNDVLMSDSLTLGPAAYNTTSAVDDDFSQLFSNPCE